MLQQLGDKCMEYAFPMAIGAAIWLGINYFELTERIMKVDLAKQYAIAEYQFPMAEGARRCTVKKAAPTMLKVGRFEAALYTASFKHVSAPYLKKLSETTDIINKKCGVDIAKTEYERRQYFEEQQHLNREAANARTRAQAEMLNQHLKTFEDVTGINLGDLF